MPNHNTDEYLAISVMQPDGFIEHPSKLNGFQTRAIGMDNFFHFLSSSFISIILFNLIFSSHSLSSSFLFSSEFPRLKPLSFISLFLSFLRMHHVPSKTPEISQKSSSLGWGCAFPCLMVCFASNLISPHSSTQYRQVPYSIVRYQLYIKSTPYSGICTLVFTLSLWNGRTKQDT